MRRFVLILALVLLARDAPAWNTCGAFDAASATTAAPGVLSDVSDKDRKKYRALCHDTTGSTHSPLLTIDTNHFRAQMVPDVGSSGTGCEMTVYTCTSSLATSADLTSCHAMWPDSDFDGQPNDNTTLNGFTIGRRGLGWQDGRWVLIYVDRNPSSDNCRIMISG